MNIHIDSILSSDKLNNIERQWDSLVDECNMNPFLLSYFLKSFIPLNKANGWNMWAVTVSENMRLLGIIPLMIKKTYGFRVASFILRPDFSPDFIIRNEKASSYVHFGIDYIINHISCHLLILDFSIRSRHLENLKQECDKAGIHYSVVPEMGHRILPVRLTWRDFEKSKGGNFRRKFRKIEHNLDKIGLWKIVSNSKKDASTQVLSKMLKVEKESWKEAWREKKGSIKDDVLLAIWDGLNSENKVQSDVDWNVWFLEIDGHPIAYTLVVVYSGIAYITKTSYNARYRRFYPGIYVNHVAIRQLWDTKNIKLIDFLTDLQFMETWTDSVEERSKLFISKHLLLPLLLGSFLRARARMSKDLKPIIENIGRIYSW
jgi:hypothetical protein